MKNIIPIALCGLLSVGCATNAPKTCHVDGTEYTVTVNYAGCGVEKATQEAEARCMQSGRHAQFAGKVDDWTNAYNCIK